MPKLQRQRPVPTLKSQLDEHAQEVREDQDEWDFLSRRLYGDEWPNDIYLDVR